MENHDENSEINKQAKEADEFNKNLPSFTGTLLYTMHPQAIYTSRLLNFKNLSEDKIIL